MDLKKDFTPIDWHEQLQQNCHFFGKVVLSDTIIEFIRNKNWEMLDQYFQKQTVSHGLIFTYLSQFRKFSQIEFIISLRDAENEWEEDGIWHDDGSRVLAFSLGLNLNPDTIQGGELYLRKKTAKDFIKISPFSFGEILVFQTGVSGFEHKINKVTKGQRLIIAGWCS